jgi:hypothetical protein
MHWKLERTMSGQTSLKRRVIERVLVKMKEMKRKTVRGQLYI